MRKTKTDFLAILRVLAAHEVDFVVVGGVSAVLQGAPISTFDLDIVHSRQHANIERLMGALGDLEAVYRGQGGRTIEPASEALASPGHQLLLTRHGPLDLLGTIGAGRSYETLIGAAEVMRVGPVRIRVLGLPEIIASKEEVGRDKDKAMIAVLKRTLEERRRK